MSNGQGSLYLSHILPYTAGYKPCLPRVHGIVCLPPSINVRGYVCLCASLCVNVYMNVSV